MTAVEKVEELINKYVQNTPIGFSYDNCVKCALIAVDEILNVLYDANDTDEEYGYWKEVKQEIEKL